MNMRGKREGREPGWCLIGTRTQHHGRGETEDDSGRNRTGKVFEIFRQDVAGD
jgi:hypothetical protein